MLDINLIRNNPDLVLSDLKKRNDTEKLLWIDDILTLDKEWRTLKSKTDELRHRRNKVALEIGILKKEGKDASEKIKEAAEIPKKIEKMEKEMNAKREKIDYYLKRLPNILHDSVPVGDENSPIKVVGEKPQFDFEPKSHIDLAENLDIGDFERAAKIAGARFFFLKGKLTVLDFALQYYAMEFMIKRGYEPIYPPYMMNRKAYEGVTDLRDFEDVMYKIEGEDLYLIATSEHPLTAMYLDEILNPKDLPKKCCGISACFRKEAGTHGRETKGFFRVHQFNKIEQIVICKPEESWEYHEELLKNATDLFETLELHFRVVNICTGDIGTVAAKKYDIETWMPVQNEYREVVSCSNCTDYQARRLNMRYRTKEGNKFVHTLNSTCIATTRALVAILENFQNADGSITMPKVLRKYTGFEKIEKE
ncbi:MAG: serine--tRNA ligase [Methanomicrobia archaeon]|nr:serine--tRNA ligase [Methanomicrobia archaeon]